MWEQALVRWPASVAFWGPVCWPRQRRRETQTDRNHLKELDECGCGVLPPLHREAKGP